MIDAFGTFGQQRPGVEVYAAFAGIEIALWDILGKRLNVPVYQLLGGTCHDTVEVYANIYSPHPQLPDDFAEMAARQVAAGHRAIKLYPFTKDTAVEEGIATCQKRLPDGIPHIPHACCVGWRERVFKP